MSKKARTSFSNVFDDSGESTSAIGKVKTSKRQGRKHEALRGTEYREVRIRGKDIYTGLVPLMVADQEGQPRTRMVGFESLTEADFWSVVNFSEADLKTAYAQPMALPIEMFGKKRHWIPDGLLEFRDGRQRLIEIKTLEAVSVDPAIDPAGAKWVVEWFNAISTSAHKHGFEFALYTDKEIRTEPRFYNAKMMARALSSQIPNEALSMARIALGDLPRETTIKRLSSMISHYRQSALLIGCLLDREGIIRLDRTTPFRAESEFVVVPSPSRINMEVFAE